MVAGRMKQQATWLEVCSDMYDDLTYIHTYILHIVLFTLISDVRTNERMDGCFHLTHGRTAAAHGHNHKGTQAGNGGIPQL